MHWVAAGAVLVLLGILLRWILKLGASRRPQPRLATPLGCAREDIYRPVAQEIVAQSAILGISLNEALEERAAGQTEMGWRLVRLAVSEWNRLCEVLAAIIDLMARHSGSSHVAVPAPTVLASRFKTRTMSDFVRIHELFNQLVFRSRLRFQLHLRLLRVANKTLSTEFLRAYRRADRTGYCPPELWEGLDHYFHDLDLIAKETLLTFRTLLVCLPASRLDALASEARTMIRRGARSTVNAAP
jgi:hypothetical protein